MPTYRQSWTHYEDGYGDVTDVIVVSDTYAGLTSASPIDVNVFDLESSKEDLDLKGSTFAVQACSLRLLGESAETEDDHAAIAFVLAARDLDVKRFVARFINPASPPVNADFAFRGVVQSEITGDDYQWSGAEYSSDPDARRNWKVTAHSFDVAHILDIAVKSAADLINPIWTTLNVRDRLGPFKDSPTAYTPWYAPRHRELRFGDLVLFEDAIQELLTVISPPGMTLTYEAVDTDLWVCPGRFYCTTYTTGSIIPIRYNTFREFGGDSPWAVLSDDFVRLRLGGSASYIGGLYINWRLISPATEQERGVSWQRYDTIAKTLFAIAAAFGMYLDVVYDTTTSLRVRFRPRSELLSSGSVYICDVEQADIKLSVIDGASESERYTGASWQLCREGPVQYNYDGGFVVRDAADRAGSGTPLPLTISPTYCLLEHKGNDVGLEADDGLGGWILPHNAVMYDGDVGGDESTLHPRGNGSDPQDSLRSIHTGMYIHVEGRDFSTAGAGREWGEYGVDGRDVYLPVVLMRTTIGGVDQSYHRLEDYCNDLYQRDGRYFEAERSLTVPYLCRFRSTESGTDDWRHLRLGRQYLEDEIQYTVVGIERSGKDHKTKIRLQASSRFAFTLPTLGATGSLPPGIEPSAPAWTPGAVLKPTRYADTDIGAGHAFAESADGRIRRASAHHTDYQTVSGICLTDYDMELSAETQVTVQVGGRIKIPESIPLDVGRPVYLRTSGIAGSNLSHEPLTTPTDTEDMYMQLGVAAPGNYLDWAPSTPWLHYPPLSD